MKETKVVKFGGSSLADAKQFKKVAEIILDDPTRRFVVASAPGKRYVEDIKVTDMLYKCYEMASEGQDFDEQFQMIKDRYNNIIMDLGIEDFSLEEDFEIIKGAFSHMAGRDYAASRGEFLNSRKINSKACYNRKSSSTGILRLNAKWNNQNIFTWRF